MTDIPVSEELEYDGPLIDRDNNLWQTRICFP